MVAEYVRMMYKAWMILRNAVSQAFRNEIHKTYPGM